MLPQKRINYSEFLLVCNPKAVWESLQLFVAHKLNNFREMIDKNKL